MIEAALGPINPPGCHFYLRPEVVNAFLKKDTKSGNKLYLPLFCSVVKVAYVSQERGMGKEITEKLEMPLAEAIVLRNPFSWPAEPVFVNIKWES